MKLGEFIIEGGWLALWRCMAWPLIGGLVYAACGLACWRIGL